MLIGALIEIADGGPDSLSLSICALPTIAIGLVVWRLTSIPTQVRARDVFVTVTLAWAVLGVVGAIPYLATGTLTAFDTALFESVSGFTTTGATVLSPIDATSRGVLMYRAITQWIGGMGVIVLVIAILPTVGAGAMSLLQAEAPGPSGERLTPRVRETARNLWLTYVVFSIAVLAAYLMAGMSPFDGFAHMFSTVSTGGFSPHNNSLAYFDSAVIDWIAIVAMVIAGGNFALYYRAARGKPGPLLRSTELHVYLLVVTLAIIAIVVVGGVGGALEERIRAAAFTVTSLVSTTGYTTVDYIMWNDLAQLILLLLLPIGAMSGSTAGGIKFVRLIALASYAHRSALRQLHPTLVRPVRVGSQSMTEDVAARIVGFAVMALAILGGGALLIALTGVDLITAASASATSFGNVGPGLGAIGPTGDFLALSAPARLVAIVQMLLGRLEIYPVILALSVVTLRRRRRVKTV